MLHKHSPLKNKIYLLTYIFQMIPDEQGLVSCSLDYKSFSDALCSS